MDLSQVEVLCLFGLLFVVDSDSDNFQSLKKSSKSKQNGTTKLTKSDTDSARQGVKEGLKSPVRPSSAQGKTTVKSPSVPATPKSAPPPKPKHTPTSVLDYFGNTTAQRSEKKLVVSTKRKAVSTQRFSCFHSFFSDPFLSGLALSCKHQVSPI